MFKKLFLLFAVLTISASVFAFDVPKNEAYYKVKFKIKDFFIAKLVL